MARTITNSLALDGTSTADLAYKLSKLNNGRVFSIFRVIRHMQQLQYLGEHLALISMVPTRPLH